MKTHDKVSVEEFNLDSSSLEFTPESLRPSRDESFATRVDGEKRRRNEGSERSDGEDESTFASDHSRYDELRDLEGGVATGIELCQNYELEDQASFEGSHVDFDNVVHVLIREVLEEGRLVVTFSDVVDCTKVEAVSTI